jgi:hypothetical protein
LVEAAKATKRLAGNAGQHGTKALSKRPARHDGNTGAILDTAAGRRAHRRTDRRTRRHVTRTATEVLSGSAGSQSHRTGGQNSALRGQDSRAADIVGTIRPAARPPVASDCSG